MGGYEICVSERLCTPSTSASAEGRRDHLRLGDKDKKIGLRPPMVLKTPHRDMLSRLPPLFN